MRSPINKNSNNPPFFQPHGLYCLSLPGQAPECTTYNKNQTHNHTDDVNWSISLGLTYHTAAKYFPNKNDLSITITFNIMINNIIIYLLQY